MGLPLPALSRLESGKNPRPAFETLARYAAGVGLEVNVVVRERGESEPRPSPAPDKTFVVRSTDLDGLLATIQERIQALRASSQAATPAVGGER